MLFNFLPKSALDISLILNVSVPHAFIHPDLFILCVKNYLRTMSGIYTGKDIKHEWSGERLTIL